MVFLLGNVSLQRLVVVELKSANLPLEVDHLNQLKYYTNRAETWLDRKGKRLKVEGHLIGSLPEPESTAEGAVVLVGEIDKAGPDAPWKIRDYLQVLEDAQAAHQELLDVYRSVEKGEATGSGIGRSS